MSDSYLMGVDVDTKLLAARLHAIADGLESDEVALTALSTSSSAEPEDTTQFMLRLNYVASSGFYAPSPDDVWEVDE